MTERATARQHSAVRSDGPAPSLRSPSRAAGVFDLHATAGNAAVTAMLGLLPRLDERAQSRAVGVVPPLRARMERALGTSVGDVAVHTDPEAGALADRAGARALTVGRHVLVAPGRYAPSTAEGEALLAHEVVHAVAHRSGATGVPSDEHEVDRAGAFAVAGIRTPVPRASSPIGRKGKNEPVVAAVPLRRLTYPDGRVAELPEPAYQAERAKAVANLRRGQRRVLDHASVDRDTHKRYLDENHVESFSEAWDRPSRLWGVAANIRAGVVPPTLGIWDSPNRLARDAAAALDRDDLHLAAGLTQRAQQALTASERQWHDFLGTSIAGGEKLQGELETTRDVSFAIAIAAAAVIAAPVVATGVAATGATGLAATGLTALGTGAVTGAGGFVLRSGSEVAGQASTGKVDVKK